MKLRFVFLLVEKSMTPIRKINTLKNNTLNLPKKCIKFSDLPELIQNTNELKKCNFYLKTGKINLPTYATPDKKDINTYLEEQAQIGLKTKLDKITMDQHKIYLNRRTMN